MDLPDCPPGTEGYEEDVAKLSKNKPDGTKAEQEFFEHLKTLKINVDDGSMRSMVQRQGRDVSGQWIYLCFPCAAVCSGENIFQTHLSGKKHKSKLATKTIWPEEVFTTHPYMLRTANDQAQATTESEKSSEVLMPALPQDQEFLELEARYKKYKNQTCYIQDSLNSLKYPLIGLEYLVEFPPQESHHDPSYLCVLCVKKGHPRTIVNHLTCFWHRFSYLSRHYPQASQLLTPFMRQFSLRAAVSLVMNRLAKCIEDRFGRLKPLLIEPDQFDNDKERISQWIFRSPHFNDKEGPSFSEVVDKDLFTSIQNSESVPAPSEPAPEPVKNLRKRDRAMSMETISDDSADELRRPRERTKDRYGKERRVGYSYDPHAKPQEPFNTRHGEKKDKNYDYKVKLARDKLTVVEESAMKSFLYHQKNPEKHPLYPDEWKKFWNRRYKELQAEGKDASKYDFKPEWIKFWTTRMKEMHDEEMQVQANEIYRKFCLRPPDLRAPKPEPSARPDERRPEPRPFDHGRRRESPGRRRDSPKRRRDSPGRRRDSPVRRRESPGRRRESPARRHASPPRRHASPPRRHASPPHRHASPPRRHESLSRPRESPRPPDRRHEAPMPTDGRSRSRSLIRSRQLYNRSPSPLRNPTPPALQTVLVSDDDLKSIGEASPWNSSGSVGSAREAPPAAAPDDVVGALRLLVALEDNLGSLGPRVVDMLTRALTMEKERANSSEELMDDDTNLTLLETAKEKLKGAVQAGLVTRGESAARAAVVRTAALLHHADRRRAIRHAKTPPAPARPAAPAPGKPQVDRAKIAQEIAAVLVAQGKTNISSHELEQLVDSVVAKAIKKKEESKVLPPAPAPVVVVPAAVPVPATVPGPAPATTPTTSALQLLQSAYDETDKKAGADPPDAMDGLSDSDLQMLLRNFNELSAEEQHSLIAYLKKLEAREPRRVERLRDYVSVAGTPAPTPAAPTPAPAPAVVRLDSDDDDYTVEEVFKSAKEKVKEKQTMQELEVVKKSLLESMVSAPAPAPVVTPAATGVASAAAVMSALTAASAANVLAMVRTNMHAPTLTTTTTPVAPVLYGDPAPPPTYSAPTVGPSAPHQQWDQQQPYEHDTNSPAGPLPYPSDTQPYDPHQHSNDPQPYNNVPQQGNNDPQQYNNEPHQYNNDPLPYNNDPLPYNNDSLPYNNDPMPYNNDPMPYNNDPLPYNNDPQPYNNDRQPFDNEPHQYNDAQQYNDQQPYHNDPQPFHNNMQYQNDEHQYDDGNYKNQNYNEQADLPHTPHFNMNGNRGGRANRSRGRGQPNQQRGHPNQQRGHPNQQRGHPSQQRGHPNQQRGQDNQQRGQDNQQRGLDNQQRGQDNQQRGNFNQARGNNNQSRGNFQQSRGNSNPPRGNANQARGTRGRGRRGRFNDNKTLTRLS